LVKLLIASVVSSTKPTAPTLANTLASGLTNLHGFLQQHVPWTVCQRLNPIWGDCMNYLGQYRK
jgi:hypothetical protein